MSEYLCEDPTSFGEVPRIKWKQIIETEEIFAAVPDDVQQQLIPAFLQTKLAMDQHSVTATRGAQGHTLFLDYKAYPIAMEKPMDDAIRTLDTPFEPPL